MGFGWGLVLGVSEMVGMGYVRNGTTGWATLGDVQDVDNDFFLLGLRWGLVLGVSERVGMGYGRNGTKGWTTLDDVQDVGYDFILLRFSGEV